MPASMYGFEEIMIHGDCPEAPEFVCQSRGDKRGPRPTSRRRQWREYRSMKANGGDVSPKGSPESGSSASVGLAKADDSVREGQRKKKVRDGCGVVKCAASSSKEMARDVRAGSRLMAENDGEAASDVEKSACASKKQMKRNGDEVDAAGSRLVRVRSRLMAENDCEAASDVENVRRNNARRIWWLRCAASGRKAD
ncbi:hypothetical protein BT63DRAFT_466112 [Microthyrium microscopicum]|uniref:Uncharacterized protein n=1 Tax=Microthyrium microscopicum TaxID=703497 RepID=A0A6A6UJU5_9PEZI|nr:hypothetical protein BT63DRAFT_466112 [Microthyrium microscopicum]